MATFGTNSGTEEFLVLCFHWLTKKLTINQLIRYSSVLDNLAIGQLFKKYLAFIAFGGLSRR